MPARKTHEIFLQEVSDRYKGEYTVLGKYKTTHTPLMLRHEECGYEWDTTAPYDLLKPKPNKCPQCATVRSWALTKEEFSEKLTELYGDVFTVTGEYINNKAKVNIMHKPCGLVKLIKPNQIMSGKYNCACISSKAASIISKNVEDLLIELGLTFEKEKGFNWLRNQLPLYLDFFLPEFNLAIEADGEQHYISKRGGDAEFHETLIRDKVKFTLCKENGISVLRIPSWLARHQVHPYLTKLLFEYDILDFAN